MTPSLILIDAHVHIHPCFNPSRLLDAAQKNFSTIARTLYPGKNYMSVLCLTEGNKEHSFGCLKNLFYQQDTLTNTIVAPWYIIETPDNISLLLSNENGQQILILSGKQINTLENVEVLALGTRDDIPDNKPIQDTLLQIASTNACMVIPWGFGKWTGTRRRIVSTITQQTQFPHLMLGDTGNRLSFWPDSSLFSEAKMRGLRLISGSDPFPIPGEELRVGSFGSILEGQLDLKRPAEDLISKLLNPSLRLKSFGKGKPFFRFLKHQLYMQKRKFFRDTLSATIEVE